MCAKILLSSIFLSFIIFNFVMAQDEAEVAPTEQVIESQPINIDGSLGQTDDDDLLDEKSPEEILEEARQKSEMKNIRRISKKIENIKIPDKKVREITDKESQKIYDRINQMMEEQEAPAQN